MTDHVNNADAYAKIDAMPRQRLPASGSSFDEAPLDTKKSSTFFTPLFRKVPQKESIYWIVLLVVVLCSLATILYFVNSYAQDMDKYQASLTSVGRYNSLTENDMNAKVSE
jgi:hypothetical protein